MSGWKVREAKPCPFCGGREIYVHTDCTEICWLYCDACSAEGPIHATACQAIANWNLRAPLSLDALSSVRKLIERLLVDGVSFAEAKPRLERLMGQLVSEGRL